jgi:hypothetical protein
MLIICTWECIPLYHAIPLSKWVKHKRLYVYLHMYIYMYIYIYSIYIEYPHFYMGSSGLWSVTDSIRGRHHPALEYLESEMSGGLCD